MIDDANGHDTARRPAMMWSRCAPERCLALQLLARSLAHLAGLARPWRACSGGMQGAGIGQAGNLMPLVRERRLQKRGDIWWAFPLPTNEMRLIWLIGMGTVQRIKAEMEEPQ